MKTNILIARLAFASLLVASVSSCTSKFEEFNRNPYEPTLENTRSDNYLLGSQVSNLQDMMMPEQENFAQFVDCLMPGGFSGYISDSNLGSGWSGRFATYNPSENWQKVPFADFFEKFYPTYFTLKNQSKEELYLALAELYRIATMLRVTDTYGPIPYSKVGVNNTISAPYDSQEAIYTKMFEDLDNVIETLTTLRDGSFGASADRIYQGRILSWAKFANSLKLRMAMRIVYAKPELAKQKAEEAVNSTVGVMTTASDGAYRAVSTKNAWELFMRNWSDARISADLICYMNGYEDPRRAVYYDMTTFQDKSKGVYTDAEGYIGLRRGIEQGKYNPWSHGYSTMKVKPSDPLVVFRASEVAFLRAEGALRGWNMGGTAQALYEEGIKLSFEERGVTSGLSTYLANNSSMPTDYVDPLRGKDEQPYDYSANLGSTITVAWDASATMERNLERIITQKWIANFPNAMEAWSEYRRTGYPKLLPMAANLSAGKVDDAKGARRLNYVPEEYRENKDHVRDAVTILGRESNNKRGDSMGTNLWWDKKSSN